MHETKGEGSCATNGIRCPKTRQETKRPDITEQGSQTELDPQHRIEKALSGKEKDQLSDA